MPNTRPADSQPTPHAALIRAGFTLVVVHDGTDPATAWERTDSEGVPVYHIQRHDENKAPHRWGHRVDVWECTHADGEWFRADWDIALADAIHLYGQPSPASPEAR